LAAALLLVLLGGAVVSTCLAVRGLQERARAELAETMSKKLDAIHRHARSLDHIKARVREELISGRLGLLEAAARYRDLTRQWPGFDHHLSMLAFPGRPENEVWVLMLLRDARDVPSDKSPQEQQLVLTRLEADFETWMHSGAPPLPCGK